MEEICYASKTKHRDCLRKDSMCHDNVIWQGKNGYLY